MQQNIKKLFHGISRQKALGVFLFLLIGFVPFIADALVKEAIYDALYWIFAILNAGLAYILQGLGSAFITIMTNHSYASEPFVLTGWAVVRDLVNLSFILVLIAIALFSILRVEKSAVRQLLPRFIAGVLLVNFSYFFCMQILNLTDGLAYGFLQPIFKIKDIIFNFVQPDNFTKINATGKESLDFQAVAAQFLGLIFIGLMVAVFFTLVIAMMVRYVFILVLIVISPFVFLLMILPQTSKFSKQWWKTFLGLAFWGPAASFFIWLAILTFQSKSSPLVGGANASNEPLLSGIKVTVGDILKYITATTFLLGALYSGKVLAGTAAGMATRYARRLGGLIGAGVMATPLGRPVFWGRALRNNVVGATKKREEYYTGRYQAGLSDKWSAAKDAAKWDQSIKGRAKAAAGVVAPHTMGYRGAYNKWQASQIAEAEKGLSGLTKDERRNQLNGLKGKNDDQSIAKRRALLNMAAKNGELAEWGLDPKNLPKSLGNVFGIKDKTEQQRTAAALTELSKSDSGDIRFAKGMKYNKAEGKYQIQEVQKYAEDIGNAVREKQLKGQDALRKLDDEIFTGDGIESLHAIGSLKRKTSQGADIDLKAPLSNTAVAKLADGTNSGSSVNRLKSQVEKALAQAAHDAKTIPLEFKVKDFNGKEQMKTFNVDRKMASDYVQNIKQIQNPNFQPAQNPRQNSNRQQQTRRAPISQHGRASVSGRPGGGRPTATRPGGPTTGRPGGGGSRGGGGPRGGGGGPRGGGAGGPGGPTGGGPGGPTGPAGGAAPAGNPAGAAPGTP